MIQRIQTVYLLLVTIFYVVALFFPYASFMTADGVEYTLSFKGIAEAGDASWHWTMTTAWYSILMAIIPAISLITVNLYKYRPLQIRLTIFNIVLMIGSYGLFFMVKALVANQIPYEVYSLSWTFIIPILCIILSYLAIRAIAKDEALVRSLNRVR